MSQVWIVIPARYASTRYPAKPLADLKGATGEARTLIRRSWDAAMAVGGIDRVLVATDDARIADHARTFGHTEAAQFALQLIFLLGIVHLF